MAAAAEYWPEQFGNLDQATADQVRQNLRQVRPVLVNGVEALIMVCALTLSPCPVHPLCVQVDFPGTPILHTPPAYPICTHLLFSLSFTVHVVACFLFGACAMLCLQARMVLEDPDCVDSIIQDWQNVLPATLKQWHVEQQDLQIFFEDFRNNLLQNKEVTVAPLPIVVSYCSLST